MSTAVLIPAFNEARTIAAVVEGIPSTLDGEPVSVIVIDDGSNDGTGEIARGRGAEVVTQIPNRGKGAALCLGLSHVRGLAFDNVVWMDADGQHLPADLPTLVEPVSSGAADLCVGSRYLLGDQVHRAPLNRRLVRTATMLTMRRLTGFAVTDPFSGYRCFSQRAVEELSLEGCGYESELESTFSVATAGFSYAEVPIPRIYGTNTSKMSHRGRGQVIAGYARTIWRSRDRSSTTRRVSVA